MALQGSPLPTRDPVVERGGLLTPLWIRWFNNLRQTVDQSPTQATTPISLSNRTATIGTTPIPSASLTAGLYRLSYVIGISVAAGVSSSLQITLSWVTGGVTRTYTGPALTTNVTTAYQTGTLFLRLDGGSPVSYALAYASNPAAAMAYSVDLALERVSA